MKKEGEGEFGANIHIDRLEKQLGNMEKAMQLAEKAKQIRLFPDGNDLSKNNIKTDIINGE